ncbi:UNKNOWN [Stylonychia lemnae]|uniref:Uncharacterized protein n=1 Tax=Stylonychia lemnae TaxID=5949 RepID=A0A078ANY0_STYLE|nr:UNKNOWN [Stylonychia lemnae]|eukprot:CDW84080.1 UNKNOWN [Stylonychia lemnae]
MKFHDDYLLIWNRIDEISEIDYQSQGGSNQEPQMTKSQKLLQLKSHTINRYLYQFTLARLSELINLPQFAYLYCNYYEEQILSPEQNNTKASLYLNRSAYLRSQLAPQGRNINQIPEDSEREVNQCIVYPRRLRKFQQLK